MIPSIRDERPAVIDDDDEPQTAAVDNSEEDEKLLQEIRQRYKFARDYWREIREERTTDMRYVCGDPWPDKDRNARTDADRPVLNHDELNQYIAQGIGNIRQNPRGIKVEPAAENTNDKTAEYRQARIRAIEYRSKAQAAYETAFQQMLEGSYGYFRIGRKWVSSDQDNWRQDIVIKTIPNPDSVLYSPDAKEPDWSDATWCFVIEPMKKEDFKTEWPDAQYTDFSNEDVNRDWVTDHTVMVAEYWKVENTPHKQKRRNPRTGKIEHRTCGCKKVVQYFTNGAQILDRIEQPGEEIPIAACIGPERYLDDGKGTTKRKIFSLVRLARDPQLMLAYLVSQEAEEAGLTPKTPFVGYTGQFETDLEAWKLVTKKPFPFLQVDPIPDSANGQILPKPERQNFTPNFPAYEIAKDSARRAIQAAMGISPLPTAAQRNTEKSGIALQRIENMQALGSFQFVGNFERALERAGRIIESWIPIYDSEEGVVPICSEDGKRRMVWINTPKPVLNAETGEPEQFSVEEGLHDVTVSTGPSSQSMRDAAQDVVAGLTQQAPAFVQAGILSPPAAATILAKNIQMLNLGPVGDEMVKAIDPAQGQAAQQQAQALGQAHQQLQSLSEYAKGLEAQVQQLTMEREAKIIDNQAKAQIEREKQAGEMELADKKLATQITVAEIQTKMQSIEERTTMMATMIQELHTAAMDRAHEAGMQAAQHAHERDLADQQHQATIAQQAAAAAEQPTNGQGAEA